MDSSAVLAFELALAEALLEKGIIDKAVFMERIAELSAELYRAPMPQVEKVLARVLGQFIG